MTSGQRSPCFGAFGICYVESDEMKAAAGKEEEWSEPPTRCCASALSSGGMTTHTSGRKYHFYFGELLFYELSEMDHAPHSSQPEARELAKHVAGAGETGEQPHFPQREPTARLAAVKSRAIALTGNAAPVSNGARSHVAAFCT